MGGVQRDTNPSEPVPVVVQAVDQNPWWWVPNAVIAATGVGLVALGVLTHTPDSHDLVVAGIALVATAAGHAAGKQSPTP